MRRPFIKNQRPAPKGKSRKALSPKAQAAKAIVDQVVRTHDMNDEEQALIAYCKILYRLDEAGVVPFPEERMPAQVSNNNV